jgi:hypothetical protein
MRFPKTSATLPKLAGFSWQLIALSSAADWAV